MKVAYAVPEGSPLRDKLKEPLGELVPEEELSFAVKSGKLIAVGDACLAKALSYGEPLIGIYDRKIERAPAEDKIADRIDNWEVGKLSVTNPAGKITEEAFELVKGSVERGDKIKIEVDGEEDLLTLPAVAYAKKDTIICYGQPHVGIVLVKPDDKTKEKVKEILKEMRV